MYRKYQYAGHGPSFGKGCGSSNQFKNAMWWEGLKHGLWRRPKYNVPLNIEEVGDTYEVHVYALGFEKSNIQISVEDDVLYIRGTRNVPEGYQPNFRRQEFPVKVFERKVELYGEVDIEHISARQDQGVLIVTLPKNPMAKAQDIPID